MFPFLLIYLHNVRGTPLGTARLVLSVTSVAGLVAGPASGAPIDQLGPRAVLTASMVVSAVGFGGFAFVHSVGPAMVAAAFAGLGNGSFWPSHATMIAGLTEREARPRRLRHAARAHRSAATAVFALALTVFGLGECFHGTVQNALIADLSQPGLLGRHLALNGFGFQLRGALGLAAGGFALALIPHASWFVASGLALGVGLSALLLERVLPEHVRRTPRFA